MFFGCIYTSTSTEYCQYFLKVHQNTEVDIMAGSVKEVERTNNYKIVSADFFQVNGGETLLLGMISIRDKKGNTYKRLKIIRKDGSIKELSIVDLESIKFSKSDGYDFLDLRF